jgi:hypothetical protein
LTKKEAVLTQSVTREMRKAWQQAAKRGIGQLRRNARRAHFALVVMSLFLAGSCRLPERSAFFSPAERSASVRAQLFSDWGAQSGSPAEGFLANARAFVSDRPDVLADLTSREVSYLFGPPTMVRNEGRAAIWQYRGDECTLNVYLDGDQGDVSAARVLGFDVWARNPVVRAGAVEVNQYDDADCIGEMTEGVSGGAGMGDA